MPRTSNTTKAYPGFVDLPPHAGIGVDVGGVYGLATIETFQLEASLFEDLASLWNSALHEDRRVSKLGPTSKDPKHAAALLRAAAKAAFNFLEGYLNGLAFDVISLRDVTPDEKRVLTEWDEVKGRSVFMTLRDKVLQYPKLALRVAHPPIQESSSPTMRAVLEAEVRIRHALIHPGPSFLRPTEFRERVFYELTLKEVGVICDEVVALVAKIAEAVGPSYGRVSRWLTRRGADGLFPPETFH